MPSNKDFLMADCLDMEAVTGVDEQADNVCGVHTVSGTSVRDIESMSSGITGGSMGAVKL